MRITAGGNGGTKGCGKREWGNQGMGNQEMRKLGDNGRHGLAENADRGRIKIYKYIRIFSEHKKLY
jgi:hypothetical protein